MASPITPRRPPQRERREASKHTLSDVIIGPPRDVRDPEIFHSLSLVAFLAWVGLGSDGLSSSCYGPEEAFLALGHHQYMAVFLAMLMALTVFIISASYSQTIDLFPSGGGGYLVATKLLGKYFGLVSGSALVVDYVLTIAISIASGADAIFSFLPVTWLPFKFWLCLLVVVLMVADEPARGEGIGAVAAADLHRLHRDARVAGRLRDSQPRARIAVNRRSCRARGPRQLPQHRDARAAR